MGTWSGAKATRTRIMVGVSGHERRGPEVCRWRVHSGTKLVCRVKGKFDPL